MLTNNLGLGPQSGGRAPQEKGGGKSRSVWNIWNPIIIQVLESVSNYIVASAAIVITFFQHLFVRKGVSTLAAMRTNYQSEFEDANDLCCAPSNTEPRIKSCTKNANSSMSLIYFVSLLVLSW